MICVYDNSSRRRTDPPSQSDSVLGAWRTLKEYCTRFWPQQAPCIYLSLAIAITELYILEPYPWFHSAQNKIFGLVEIRVHAALAMPATPAALGAIFQPFPALCPCEPRLPRGEIQAVPFGARSNTWLLPASTSQPPPAGIRSVRKYNTGICLFVQVKTVLTFGHV